LKKGNVHAEHALPKISKPSYLVLSITLKPLLAADLIRQIS
jgi:hypothetical protein